MYLSPAIQAKEEGMDTLKAHFKNVLLGCRHCRFERCLRAGMDASEVTCVKPLQRDADSTLSTVIACRNKTYARRGLFLREIDDKHALLGASTSGRTYEEIFMAEYQVLAGFWTDYAEHFGCFKPAVSSQALTPHFFVIWYVLENLLATAAHGRFDTHWVYFDRATVFRVGYDHAVDFYRALSFLKNPEILAELTLEDCDRALHLARMIRRAALDDYENVALLQLLIAYYEKDMFVNAASHRSFISRTLRELHEHYQSTYSNYAERLGTLTMIMGEFNRLIITNDELVTSIALYSIDDRVKGGNAHDLRRSVKLRPL
ncbi:hypothetical protein AAVH_25298 [Aphelenchoides avenae]|nr:hypothetical protein AAVH_25298 [Aphelenchus avenae]